MNSFFRNIAKCGILACLLYVQWYKWVYGERTIILYSTAGIATICMVIDLLFTHDHENKKTLFPYGCINNITLCCYSLIIGLFVATSTNTLFSAIKTLLAFSMTCMAFCYASSDDGIEWIINGIIAIAIVCSLWTMFRGYYYPRYGMVLSPTNNPHTLGVVMDLGLFALAFRCKHNAKSFVLHMLLASLFLYIIIQCGSRKCLLAAAIIMVPWLLIAFKSIYREGTIKDRRIIVLCYMIIPIAIVYYYFHEYVGSISYERLADIEESHANQLRLSYYQLGMQFFSESPFFGIGLGQFAIRNPDGGYSHSTIVETFASWGAVGGLLYLTPMLLAMYRSAKIAIQNRDYQATIIAALCVMEVFMAFLQIFFYSLQHMITWSIIFIFIHMKTESRYKSIRRYKYVKY